MDGSSNLIFAEKYLRPDKLFIFSLYAIYSYIKNGTMPCDLNNHVNFSI